MATAQQPSKLSLMNAEKSSLANKLKPIWRKGYSPAAQQTLLAEREGYSRYIKKVTHIWRKG